MIETIHGRVKSRVVAMSEPRMKWPWDQVIHYGGDGEVVRRLPVVLGQ